MTCLILGAGLSLTVCPEVSLLSFGAALSGLPAAYRWLAESRAYFLVGADDLVGVVFELLFFDVDSGLVVVLIRALIIDLLDEDLAALAGVFLLFCGAPISALLGR